MSGTSASERPPVAANVRTAIWTSGVRSCVVAPATSVLWVAPSDGGEDLRQRRDEAGAGAVDPVLHEVRIVRGLLAVTPRHDDVEIALPVRGRARDGARDHLRGLVRLALEVRRAERELLRPRPRRVERGPLVLRLLARPVEHSRDDLRRAPAKAALFQLVAPADELLVEKGLDRGPPGARQRVLVPELALECEPRRKRERRGPRRDAGLDERLTDGAHDHLELLGLQAIGLVHEDLDRKARLLRFVEDAPFRLLQRLPGIEEPDRGVGLLERGARRLRVDEDRAR